MIVYEALCLTCLRTDVVCFVWSCLSVWNCAAKLVFALLAYLASDSFNFVRARTSQLYSFTLYRCIAKLAVSLIVALVIHSHMRIILILRCVLTKSNYFRQHLIRVLSKHIHILAKKVYANTENARSKTLSIELSAIVRCVFHLPLLLPVKKAHPSA